MSGTDHLLPEARRHISLPMDQRIAFARRDVWIEHPGAGLVLRELDDLLSHPRVERMPCLLVAAASGNGKSTLLKKFRADHPVRAREGGIATMPVLLMDMPAKPQEWRFWSGMLKAMSVAHREKAATNEAQAIRVFQQLQCRMLVIDEIHNVLQGTVSEQRHFLTLLKNLTNELMLPVVVAGTQDAIRTMHTDAQLADRFQALRLPKWRLDADYLSLLASYESLMPLAEPSGLATRDIAVKLFDMSGRTIGTTARLVRDATAAVIRRGQERITPAILDEIRNAPLRGYKGEDL